jgi:hypothetical protein
MAKVYSNVLRERRIGSWGDRAEGRRGALARQRMREFRRLYFRVRLIRSRRVRAP